MGVPTDTVNIMDVDCINEKIKENKRKTEIIVASNNK